MIRTKGKELAEKGYYVCPIAPREKYPLGKDWINHPLSPDQCADYPVEDAGVGVICGKDFAFVSAVYAFDVDIEGDEEFSDAMRQWFASRFDIVAYRVGRAPKILIPVTADPGIKKTMSPCFIRDGLKAQLEFLGDGQQFVAYGIHPKTGQPYQWFGELPVFYELPSVSIELVQEAINEFSRQAIARGWHSPQDVARGNYTASADADLEAALTPQHRLGINIEKAREYLQTLSGAEDYDQWLKVGMSLHFEFGGTQDERAALLLWDEWSSGASNYQGLSDLEYRWEGFGRRTGRSVTMSWIKWEYDKAHDDRVFELTEFGRARRMASIYKGSLYYARDARRWYRWNGIHWEVLGDGAVEGIAMHVCGEQLRADIEAQVKGDDALKHAWSFYFRCQKSAFASGVVRSARSLDSLACLSTNFDSNSRYFGVGNGDIDLRTGEFVPPDKAHLTCRSTPVNYVADAKCPLWEQTLLEAFDGNAETVEYLQRIFGYAMLGNPNEEAMFIFHGSGNNGKSTILNTIRYVFGQYACSLDPDTVTSLGGKGGGNGGGARADVVALQGRRLALVPETEEKAKLREATVKRLVSTDQIAARGVYEAEMRYFTPTWVPIMATNYLPRVDGTDDGIWRRIHPIGFNRNFDKDPNVKRDVHRAEKLREEASGILNWLIAGVKAYHEKGIVPPKSVLRESAEYRASMDALQEWIDERCVVGASTWMTIAAAWASWSQYAEGNGLDRAITSKMMLTQRLYKKGVSAKNKRIGKKVCKCYFGIGLAEDFEELAQDVENAA